jgi:hypothetical protein
LTHRAIALDPCLYTQGVLVFGTVQKDGLNQRKTVVSVLTNGEQKT